MYNFYTNVICRQNRRFSKILLVMKLTTLIMVLAILQVSARSSAQKITFSQKKATVKQVFKEIKKQTGFDVFYLPEMFKADQTIDANFKDAPIKEIMDKVLIGQPLTYTIDENTIVINKKSISHIPEQKKDANSIRITGVVTDSTGTPLTGATVTVVPARNEATPASPDKEQPKISSASIFTDEKGVFSIDVSEGDMISISFIGYQTYIFTAKQKAFLKITLHPASTQLKEVIINTGYQLLSKERATGSFSKPDMAVIAKRGGTMDLIGRMEGLVPGLVLTFGDRSVSANNNGNGVTTRNSLIRGTSTILTAQNSAPLLVLNGVIVPDFGTLNLDDVADITVLKDAAALAIYGAQSANGVVVVTTKTGSKQLKPVISYSGYINFRGKPNLNYIPVLNSQQYIQTAKEIFSPSVNPYSDFLTNIAPHETILYNLDMGNISQAQANKSLDSLGSISNAGQIKNLFYRNAFTNNHTVSASGGGGFYSYYGSLGYTQEHNNSPGAVNNTYRVNLTQSFNPGDRVKISLNTSLQNLVTSSGSNLNVSNTYLPYQLFQDAKGNAINMPFMTGYEEGLRQTYEQQSGINLDYYPLNELNYTQSKNNLLAVNVTANGTVQLFKGLSFQGTYGYQKLPGTISSFTDGRSLALRKRILGFTAPAAAPGESPTYYIPATGGDYLTGNNDSRSWTVRNQLVYQTKTANGRDDFSFQLGQEVKEFYNYRTSNVVLGYDQALGTYAQIDYNTLNTNGVPGGSVIGNIVSLLGAPFNISKSLSRFNSYFALGSYTYNNKFSLDASIRQDQSSLFGSDVSTQSKPFWSAGGKWRMSNEAFMKSITWVNDLSLRATYGVTGNSPYNGAGTQSDVISALSGSLGQIAGDAFVIQNPSNRQLQWESTSNINLGLNFALLNNRISGSVDYYYRNSTGLLGTTPINPLTGFVSVLGNVGRITNKGLELGLTTENIRGKHFGWSTNFTFAYNKNKIISLTKPNLYSNVASYGVSTTLVPGLPIQSLFAYRYAGLDNLGDPQIMLHDGTITKKINAAKTEDLKYMGTLVPLFNGGLSNTVRYNRLSLTANIVYSLGNVMRRDVNQFYTGRLTNDGFRSGNIAPSFLDRWKNPGDEAFTDIPSYVAAGKINASRRNTAYYTLADINVVSASYAKLRDVTLSYTFAPQMLKSVGIQSLNIYGQATNFLIWTANKYHIDPEYQSLNSGFRGIPPFTHGYTLGLSFTL